MSALRCPNCGAVHEPNNPGIVVIVCGHCASTLYLQDEVLRQGEASVVREPRGKLAVGAVGTVDGTLAEVIGRVSLAHPRGQWDEWYLRTADGGTLWLVEDEKSYAIETPLPQLPAGAHPAMDLGDAVEVDGLRFEVREHGQATCEGGEGQLPRQIYPGERVRYADLIQIGGRRVLTLEFDADGEGEAFEGRTLDPEALQFSGGDRPGPAQVVEASTITCPSCAAPFPLPRQGEPARTATCPACDAVLELTGAEARATGRNEGRARYLLPIGARGELLGHTWEVVGRARYRDDEGYAADEYLCWSEDAGYLWLEHDAGHFAWARPYELGVSLPMLRMLSHGDALTVQGTRFAFQTEGQVTLEHVDGALPWAAARGDRGLSWSFANPPDLLNVEREGDELEVFRGAWVPPGVVERAFRVAPGRPRTVHYAQPNPWGPLRAVAFAALCVALLNGLLALTLSFWPSRSLVEFTVPAAATGGQEVHSPPFQVDPVHGPLLGIRYHAGVDNSWAYVELELVDAEEETTVGLVGQEVEYYHGREGGESWSEGARTTTRWLSAPPAGAYQLVGTLEYDRPTAVTVSVWQGPRLARYNLCLFAPFGLIAALLLGQFFRFEHRRSEDA